MHTSPIHAGFRNPGHPVELRQHGRQLGASAEARFRLSSEAAHAEDDESAAGRVPMSRPGASGRKPDREPYVKQAHDHFSVSQPQSEMISFQTANCELRTENY